MIWPEPPERSPLEDELGAREFTDEQLALLAPAFDDPHFIDPVATGREPRCTLIHAYKGETGHRKNQAALAGRARDRQVFR